MPLPRALQSLHCFWRHRRKKLTAISRKHPHSCLHLNSSQCCHLNQPLIISNINCCDISNSYLWLHHLYVLKCISYSHPSASPLARVLFCPDLSKRLCKTPACCCSPRPSLTQCHIVSNLSRQGTDLFEVWGIVTGRTQF